jgi:hypothetical protein
VLTYDWTKNGGQVTFPYGLSPPVLVGQETRKDGESIRDKALPKMCTSWAKPCTRWMQNC